MPPADLNILQLSSLNKFTIAQLTALLGKTDPARLPHLIKLLAADSRQGAQRLARQGERRLQQAKILRQEFHRRFRLERKLWRQGFSLVAGVDEAGRGPLAGPVVAAAVVLPPDCYLPGLQDSKNLSPRRRERLYWHILSAAGQVAVAGVSVARIDQENIHRASQLAMVRAVKRLPIQPHFALIDGFSLPHLNLPHRAVVGGDDLSNSIAAAAIVAKVHRDRLMLALHRRYPQYGFAQHKGYGTREHRAALRQYGPTPHHRRSFRW